MPASTSRITSGEARPARACRIRLSSVTVRDLRIAQRGGNVMDLLEIAQQERRMDPFRSLQLVRGYSALPAGDELLLRCLQVAACEPKRFLSIVQTSPLHAAVVQRAPNLNPVQVNLWVGQISENMMTRYFRSTNWEQAEGQVGRTGMDGLFVQREDGMIRDMLVVESKYNGALLADTNHGTQMSKDWLLRKLQELKSRYPDNPDYPTLERLMQGDAYRGVLWQFDAGERELQVTLTRVYSKGESVVFKPLETNDVRDFEPEKILRIPLDGDRSAFQRTVGGWYQEELAMVPTT